MGALASPQNVGRYAIYGKIASGGMASVHFGRMLGGEGFARTVAIKRLHPHLAEDPEFRSTLIDEARVAARIHHPNVVPTLDVVSTDGELLVVMEYIRGESLSRLVRAEKARGSRIPLPIASAIAIGTLQGLHAAHEATSNRGEPLGVVHRDVSPQNILVGVDGVARVIDFGVAKAAGRLQTTREGVLKGKMAYMAPEQLAAAKDITRSADVYAMGVVLWEVLAGERLFQADSDTAVFGLVLAGANNPPSHHAPDLPKALDELVMKALAPDPPARFASAQDMAELLLHVVPPASQIDVGRWVQEVASDGLAQRGAVLAEIESSSAIVSVPPRAAAPTVPEGVLRGERVAGGDEPLTVASQPSSVSLETPKRGSARSRRVGPKLAGVLGVAVLLAAALVALRLRGPQAPATATVASGPSVLPVSSSPPAPPASASDEPAPADTASVPVPAASTSANRGSVVRPAAPRKPSPAPRTSAPFRFAQPD